MAHRKCRNRLLSERHWVSPSRFLKVNTKLRVNRECALHKYQCAVQAASTRPDIRICHLCDQNQLTSELRRSRGYPAYRLNLQLLHPTFRPSFSPSFKLSRHRRQTASDTMVQVHLFLVDKNYQIWYFFSNYDLR